MGEKGLTLRFAPFVLAALALWGPACPQSLPADDKSGGRRFFLVILALALLAFWRNVRRSG